MRYKVLLLFGPPGAGKGTQGKLLSMLPSMLHLATGDMFRALAPESELGKRVATYSSRGELVPDELTVQLWQEHVAGRVERGEYDPTCMLLVLDGIPRTPDQAEAMSDLIEVLGIIHLTVADIETMVQRIKKRAEREGRKDDADEAVIRRRFEVYENETAPVLGHYPQELLTPVDALGMPIEVLQRVLTAVVPIMSGRFRNPLE